MKAKLILYSYQDGSTSFKLRLTDKGRRGYEAVEVPFTKKEWKSVPKKRINELQAVMPKNKKRYEIYRRNNEFVKTLEKKYQDEIDNRISLGKSFSFSQIFQVVKNPRKEKPQTFYSVFDYFISKEKKRQAFGNAANIQGTLNKLKKYHKKDLLFNEVDRVFLMEFRESMENSNLSKNTISIHLRNIRTVFNYAIKKLQVASLADYPFIDGDIQGGLKTAYKSRALTLSEVNSIRDYRLKQEVDSDLWHACNYFIFGYAGRGINFIDIARLKWDDYKGGRIYFTRRKTRSKIAEETNFPVTPELKEILQWYREHNRQLGNHYIFPILNGNHKTEKSKRNRIEKTRTELNSLLKRIGKELKTSVPITTYVWRHSFAGVAKNDLKVDVSMISEMLGHHDLETTQHYLKQFPDDDKDNAVIGL